MDELSNKKISSAYQLLQFKRLKYLKIMNTAISGLYLNGLVAAAERACFKNVIFESIHRQVTESECRYITMKSCSNL